MNRFVLFFAILITVNGCNRGEPSKLEFMMFSRRIGSEMLLHREGDQGDLLAKINMILEEREASLIMKKDDVVVWEKRIVDEDLILNNQGVEEIVYIVKDGRSDWTFSVWD